MHLEMFQTHHNSYTVIVDGRFQPMLTQDEALWVCAKAIMGEPHRYLQTYEEWKRREAALLHSNLPKPVAAIESNKNNTEVKENAK